MLDDLSLPSPFRAARSTSRLDHFVDDAIQGRLIWRRRRLVTLRTIELQHSLERQIQSLSVLVDVLRKSPDHNGVQWFGVANQFAEAFDADESGSKLMPDPDQELGLQPVEPLERGETCRGRRLRAALPADGKEDERPGEVVAGVFLLVSVGHAGARLT